VVGSVLDSSVLIDWISRPNSIVNAAIAAGDAVIPPLVVAELVTGATTAAAREEVGILLQDVQIYPIDLEHWIQVGLTRQMLRRKGLTLTLPDAHIAQCALELDATLITRDAIFAKIADHTDLRVITA
jgi:predicted nucleic acid-binding protein